MLRVGRTPALLHQDRGWGHHNPAEGQRREAQLQPGRDHSHAGVLRVPQTRADTRRFYNEISKVYDLLAERSEASVPKAGLEKLAVAAGERVLEPGVGTGHCLAALAQAGGPTGKVNGIDLSEGMLAQARELLRQEQLTNLIPTNVTVRR